MDSLIAAIIAIGLLLIGGLTVFETALSTQDEVVVSWQEMEERLGDQARTFLEPISVTTKSSGSIVELTLRNEGSTKLADFDRWDMFFQYYTDTPTYEMDWYQFVLGVPGNNQWTVSGIYVNAASAEPEVYEPGILNPGEEIVVQLQVQPSIGLTTTNLISINTNNGIRASKIITR